MPDSPKAPTTPAPTSVPVSQLASTAAVDAAEAHLDTVDLDAARAAVDKLTKTLPGL